MIGDPAAGGVAGDIVTGPANVILQFSGSGFDATRVVDPTVAKVGGVYDLLYAGLPFADNYQIGLAMSSDGSTWTRSPSNPVISNAESPSWASFREFPVTLMYENGTYELWFNGDNSDLSSSPGYGTGFGYATSTDGVNWTIGANPIRWEMNSPSGTAVNLDEVVKFGAHYIAYYQNSTPSVSTIDYAISADGQNFSDDAAVSGLPIDDNIVAATTTVIYGVNMVFAIVQDANGAFHYATSTDGTHFDIRGAVTVPSGFTPTDIIIQDDQIELFGDSAAGNVNWGYGNVNTAVVTAPLPSLPGAGGDDVLFGGGGKDTLTGGAGSDTFGFDQASLTSAEASSGVFDTITDYDQGDSGTYSAAEGDKIDLSALLSSDWSQGAGQPVQALVRAVEDVRGQFALLQIDPDGAANGANWITIAQLTGLRPGNNIAVVLDSTAPSETISVSAPIVSVATFLGEQASLDATLGGFIVANSAAAIGANLDALAADPDIVSIMISDNSHVVISVGQLTSDASAIGVLANADGSPYQLAVVDTAANIAADSTALNALIAAGHISTLTQINPDGSYDVRHYNAGTFWGLSFASIDDAYSSGGQLTGVTAYDASGNVLGTETIQANGSFTVDENGSVYLQKTVNPDGSYDVRHYTAGTFWGLSFASIDDAYSSGGQLTGVTAYDASGNVLGTQTFQANGSFTVDENGSVYLQKTVNPDGSYDVRHYTAGTFWGLSFASIDDAYSSGGQLTGVTAYDASGNVLGTETIQANGSFTVDENGSAILQKTVNPDGSYDVAVFNITGRSYTSYKNVFGSGGSRAAFVTDNVGGSGTLTLYGSGNDVSVAPDALSVTTGVDVFSLNPHASETINATGTTSDSFLFAPASGSGQTPWMDLINGLDLSGGGANTIQFNASAFGASNAVDAWNALLNSATTNSAGWEVIHDNYGDSLTLNGATSTMLSGNQGDFKFV